MPCSRRERADRVEHRRWAAGVDLGVGVGPNFGIEEVGHEAVVAGRAVVGGELGVLDQGGALGVVGVAEAEQGRGFGAEGVGEDRQRRRADASADEHRAGGPRAAG